MVAELTRVFENGARLRCGVSLCRHQRLPKCDLKLLLPRKAVGLTRNKVKILTELRDRFGHGTACERLLARFEQDAEARIGKL